MQKISDTIKNREKGCGECRNKVDIDINGARNILMKT
jgi:transposase